MATGMGEISTKKGGKRGWVGMSFRQHILSTERNLVCLVSVQRKLSLYRRLSYSACATRTCRFKYQHADHYC